MSYTLTTPLYYVNDRAHLGSTYTTLACDSIARFHRLSGKDVIFITGCDEHGLKIQRTAQASGLSPQSHCNHVSSHYLDLWAQWRISNDRFIRTTDSRHRSIVEQFFSRVMSKGDVVEGHQQGWYCVACEEFKDDSPEAKHPYCAIHQRPLEWRDETNLFFRLSRYQKAIENLVASPSFIAPASRRREVQNFVAGGLQDFSISRIDLQWGIPVPGHPGHTFYVWFDALVGYLSALLLPEDPVELDLVTMRGWPAELHVIGKDILRFHAVFWPAMLMSADLPLPKQVFGHGFLTREGQKMGKSLGNVLNPELLLERCGRDAVRWYLLRDIGFGEDGDFQQQRFCDLVNNDLVNTIGNLLNRTISMARKWFEGAVPPAGPAISSEHPLALKAMDVSRRAGSAMAGLAFKSAAEAVVELAGEANGFLNQRAPWKLMKQEGQGETVGADLYAVLETCRWVGLLLAPILPDLSGRILCQLSLPPFDSDHPQTAQASAPAEFQPELWLVSQRWGLLPEGSVLPLPEPVMQRLELSDPL